MGILPGQLAFFFVLSLIPLIALIGSLGDTISISSEYLKDAFSTAVPSDIQNLLSPLTSGKGLNLNMSLFYITSFILASNGTHSMIVASNELYKFKNKDYLSRRIKAIIMTIVLVVLLLFMLIVPAFGDKILSIVLESANKGIADTTTLIYNILKYPISLILIYFCIKLLYTIAPDSRIKSKSTTGGAIFTTIGWIIATKIYSIYVAKIAVYNIFYGSISNILILLLWVYILAYIFVLGMALNSSAYQKEIEE